MGMKFFIIITYLAFLCVMAYMPLLERIVDEKYRVGMDIVPIVMVAEVMMGIYFNLSFWYKLTDQTIWGAIFSLTGCAVLLIVNLLFIPVYGYMACAWAGLAGYMTAMLFSYFVGQKKNPIDYDLRSIGIYTLVTAVLYAIMHYTTALTPSPIIKMTIGTVCVLLFMAFMTHRDLPLRPVVAKIRQKIRK